MLKNDNVLPNLTDKYMSLFFFLFGSPIVTVISVKVLPIFKDFVENALYKDDFDEFKIPENIYLTSLNYDTGMKSAPGEKNIIVEALKLEDINNINDNNLISVSGHDTMIKFRQFY